MRPILALFWNLCLLRTGPEHMPTTGFFVALVVAANMAVSIIAATFAPVEPTLLQAVSIPVVAAAVLAGATYGVLSLRSLGHRFAATFTALMGADAVITTLSWPLLLLAAPDGRLLAAGLGWVLTLVQLALIFWWVTIAGFVFSRALSASMPQGIAVAVMVILVSLMVTAAVVPLEAPVT